MPRQRYIPGEPAPEYSVVFGQCGSCRKVAYPSRRIARDRARRLNPGHRMSVYRCDRGGDGWHIGHNAHHPRPS